MADEQCMLVRENGRSVALHRCRGLCGPSRSCQGQHSCDIGMLLLYANLRLGNATATIMLRGHGLNSSQSSE